MEFLGLYPRVINLILKRFINEYLYGLSDKNDKLEMLYKKDLKNLKSLEGKKNTLIIMNSKSLHSRGIRESGLKKTLFIDFRFLNSILNIFSLYKLKKVINKFKKIYFRILLTLDYNLNNLFLNKLLINNVKKRNNKLKFKINNIITLNRSIFYYEEETLDWIETFNEEETFWDIGACTGVYSIIASKKFKLLHLK